MNNKNKKGTALLTLLAVLSMVLVFISISTLSAVLHNRSNYDLRQKQKLYERIASLQEETSLRLLREGAIGNSYLQWTDSCLQLSDWQCKMETDLASAAGKIDIWAKTNKQIRHMQFAVDILEDKSVSISALKDIY